MFQTKLEYNLLILKNGSSRKKFVDGIKHEAGIAHSVWRLATGGWPEFES
jgi:hypothetical protein